MHPLDPTNRQFSHDFDKFVFQDPNTRFLNQLPPEKPFKIEKPAETEKSKKDLEKQKKKSDDRQKNQK